MKIYGAYNYDQDLRSLETSIAEFSPSMTRQTDAIGTDINDIVKEYGLTGTVPAPIRYPTFEDFSESVDDYQTALNAVIAAQESFMQLPADTRKRFDNDPQKLLEFVNNPSNYAKAKEYGLLVPSTASDAAISPPPATPAAGPAA